MAGNVAEWVFDKYVTNYREGALKTDPIGPMATGNAIRGRRGGNYNSRPEKCRAANRGGALASDRSREIGLRPVRTCRPGAFHSC